MKKFTRLALVLGITGVMTVNAFASVFTDVSESHWAYGSMKYMQEQQYMLKNKEGQFLPGEAMSYFDFAEILAQMTGYKDPMTPGIDPVLADTIAKMYAQELPYIQQYDNDARYKEWDDRVNEEIAYILARGYMSRSDLQRFMIKSATGQEMNAPLLKQDLARYIVFYLGKANTAVSQYTSTGFTDEASIREENRPYVAYLKQIGVIGGNSEGGFGANDQVTRALGAVMLKSAIDAKENMATTTPPTVTTPEPEVEADVLSGTVDKIVPRDTEQTFILIKKNGTTKFYTANKETQVMDSEGRQVDFEVLEVGHNITVEVDGDDYLKSIQILDVLEEEEEVPEEVVAYTGTVDRISGTSDLTVYTSKGAITLDIAAGCNVYYDNKLVTLGNVEVGDEVRIEAQGEYIINIEILEKPAPEVKEVTFVGVQKRANYYVFEVEEGGKVREVSVPRDVALYRNEDAVSTSELTIGDTLVFTYDTDGEIEKIEATATKTKVEGTIVSILIAKRPELVLQVDDKQMTLSLTDATEYYNQDAREDIALYDLRLGMAVEVRVESEQAMSVIVESIPEEITYEGIIQSIEPGAKEMEILLTKDSFIEEKDALKTIMIPTDVEIFVNRQYAHRKELKEAMEVRIVCSYDKQGEALIIEGWTR